MQHPADDSELGAAQSPWQLTSDLVTTGPWPDATDVLVIGAGVCGATCALLLARAGLAVTLVDRRDPLTFSTSARATVKATAGQGLRAARIAEVRGQEVAVAYLRMQEQALATIAELAMSGGPEVALREAPQLVYTRTVRAAADLERSAELAREAGVSVHSDAAAVPWRTTAAHRYAGLSFHAGYYLRGLLSAGVAAGVQVRFGEVAQAVSDTGPVVVRLGDAAITAERLVVATQSPFLLRGLHFTQLQARRHYGISIQAQGPASDLMTYDATGPTVSTRPLPGVDGAGGEAPEIVVVGAAHQTGSSPAGNPWRELVNWARAHFETGAVTRHWAAQDYASFDGAPLIGAIGVGNNGIMTASGFGAWGFTTATFAAEQICRELTGQPDRTRGMWSPTRLGGVRAAARLARWQGQTGGRLVAGLARGLRAKSPGQLAPGEAGISWRGMSQVAAYRDQDGELHEVSAHCSHLGCTLAWNPHELSWDCPCHGSRFDIEGEVLDAPAAMPLKPL